LANIHDKIALNIPPEYHAKVFFEGKQAQVTGSIINSISSRSYASIANQIIALQNPPNDTHDYLLPVPPTKPKFVQLSYANATKNYEEIYVNTIDLLAELNTKFPTQMVPWTNSSFI